MGQVTLAALVLRREAQPRLLLSLERQRGLIGMASMGAIHAVDGGTAIPLEPEQRADAIHGSQDTNSPAGKTGGADV